MTDQPSNPTSTSSSASSPIEMTGTEDSKNHRARPSIWEIYYPQKTVGHRDMIYVSSFPQIIYFWPTLLTCFFCALFQGAFGLNPVAVGWLMIAVIVFNFLVLVQDFDQKQFIIIVLAFFALILIGWIINLYGFSFLGAIFRWIASFSPSMSTDTYIVIGTGLFILFVWGAITPMFSYWTLEQNEFIHYTQPIGRDSSIARAGCSIYKEIPDVFECILSGGGGTLVVKRDGQVLATIPNIPFLGKRMDAIEHLLSETRVVVENLKGA